MKALDDQFACFTDNMDCLTETRFIQGINTPYF